MRPVAVVGGPCLLRGPAGAHRLPPLPERGLRAGRKRAVSLAKDTERDGVQVECTGLCRLFGLFWGPRESIFLQTTEAVSCLGKTVKPQGKEAVS